jgi:predicted hotdog family 3-hydroxylacyl-ACP dehydratase
MIPPIASLVPHQGTMCLLERVVAWDAQSVTCATTTHRAPDHPLRHAGRLRAVHLCEYGAQAMAVHGALQARAAGRAGASPGMLVSLRGVTFTRDFIEDLEGELTVHAECLQASAAMLQYVFRVTHEGYTLCEGRAAVVLGSGG